jgi:fluoroacetyl-CoA thioesterase
MNFPGIKTGMSITIARTISESDTVGNHLPDDIELMMSTPGLVSIMIEASVRMIDPLLPDGFLSVGKSTEVVHDHPTVVGSTIHVTVTVVEFDGYHITIAMEAADEMGSCGRGTHTRTIVNKRWLNLRIAKRLASL